MATEAVTASGVHKTYGDTVALDGVDLSVERGEVFGLIGPNGAGKTTLVRCFVGATSPDAGRVELLGGPPAAAARDRVGLLPQSFAPADRLTGRELVAYYAGLYEDARDPDAVLSAVGVEARATRYENLSGGQRRRVCVAAALVNDPDVLFLDEPMAGIDPAGRRALREVIERLADAGTTVFLTTHDMAEARRMADRVGLLAAGELVAVGTPASLVAAHGGESTLTVETPAGPAALADTRFAERARAVPTGVEISGVDPSSVGDVVRALDAAGVAFAGLSWSEPDLEDVYLELSGQSARDGRARTQGENS